MYSSCVMGTQRSCSILCIEGVVSMYSSCVLGCSDMYSSCVLGE